MASGGLRLRAWDYLKWGNVIPIVNDSELVAAKIIVYDGEEDGYFSLFYFVLFITSIKLLEMVAA